jgi:AcrR family transcriptional regulator
MTSGYAPQDATREKLIEAAGRVFAEVGFHDATVREICARAGTNVAAVNYYFGEKLGLYTEVLRSSIFAEHQSFLKPDFPYSTDPRASLRGLICEWIKRLSDGGRSAWFARIMAHEMAHPTAALDLVSESMSGNYLRFRTVVGRVIGRSPDDARTRMCLHSVVGQVLHYVQARPMLARLWPDLNLDNEDQRRAIADHIVKFSLAGMDSIARRKTESSGMKNSD